MGFLCRTPKSMHANLQAPTKSSDAHGVAYDDLFSEVRPTGTLGKALDAIENPRKHRWNAYLRACRNIPASSPVHGSTSFKKLNDRRHELISEMFAADMARESDVKDGPEYKAVSRATSAWHCGPMVASNFLMSRVLRRLESNYPENV